MDSVERNRQRSRKRYYEKRDAILERSRIYFKNYYKNNCEDIKRSQIDIIKTIEMLSKNITKNIMKRIEK
jgi:hypothetical protein